MNIQNNDGYTGLISGNSLAYLLTHSLTYSLTHPQLVDMVILTPSVSY